MVNLRKLIDVSHGVTGVGGGSLQIFITYPEYKVIWLGSQVDQLNDRYLSFATQFRLYYRITDPITALFFPSPTESITRALNQASSTQAIQSVTMTPATPSPSCALTYTVVETSVVSSGATLTLDSSSSPSVINIPDLTGIAAGTYTFEIEVTSVETI